MKTPSTALVTLILSVLLVALLVTAIVVLTVSGHGNDAASAQFLLLVGVIVSAIVGTIAGGRVAFYSNTPTPSSSSDPGTTTDPNKEK